MTNDEIRQKAQTFLQAHKIRTDYTVARIPGAPGNEGKKGSLRAIANRMRNELKTQQYYKEEGVREFVSYLFGEGALPELDKEEVIGKVFSESDGKVWKVDHPEGDEWYVKSVNLEPPMHGWVTQADLTKLLAEEVMHITVLWAKED